MLYGPLVSKGNLIAGLDWSYNEFAKFSIVLLESLEKGKRYEKDSVVYGQVFDKLDSTSFMKKLT